MDAFDLRLVLQAEGAMTLSRPTEADVDQLVEACQDPEIVRFTQVPSPYTREHARNYVLLSVKGAEEGAALNLLGRDADGRLLGAFGMPRVSPPDLSGEIGYWVAPWARRQGVATRATRAVCRWAFEVGGFERLHLEAAAINAGSNGVARRLGSTLEGTLRQAALEGATGQPGGPRWDLDVWGLLPGELT